MPPANKGRLPGSVSLRQSNGGPICWDSISPSANPEIFMEPHHHPYTWTKHARKQTTTPCHQNSNSRQILDGDIHDVPQLTPRIVEEVFQGGEQDRDDGWRGDGCTVERAMELRPLRWRDYLPSGPGPSTCQASMSPAAREEILIASIPIHESRCSRGESGEAGTKDGRL